MRLKFRDHGTGIPPELLEKVMNPFITTKPAGVGTGLGLSITRKLVLAMHGELACESTLGDGATFAFRLPRAVASH